MELVPGTGESSFNVSMEEREVLIKLQAAMNDQSDVPREYEQVPREYLKHGTGRLSHVILVPQPSDSPNDPLNVRLSIESLSLFLD